MAVLTLLDLLDVWHSLRKVQHAKMRRIACTRELLRQRYGGKEHEEEEEEHEQEEEEEEAEEKEEEE